jgi:hypothetical protein
MNTVTRNSRSKLAIALTAATLTAGCADDAVVGGDTDPITFTGRTGAEIEGTLGGQEFGQVGAVFYDDSDGPGILNLRGGVDQTLALQLVFSCGPAEVDVYSIISGADNRLSEYCESDAPVATVTFFGADQTATIGTNGLIAVDEVGSCVAGRFTASFDSDVLEGWFSADLSPNG